MRLRRSLSTAAPWAAGVSCGVIEAHMDKTRLHLLYILISVHLIYTLKYLIKFQIFFERTRTIILFLYNEIHKGREGFYLTLESFAHDTV